MTRIKLTLAYDGTDFCGWQLQPRDRTVQGELEKALEVILGTKVRVHGSGRTDSGVHALGQVVHFDCAEKRRGLTWQRSLNGLLPPDVRVLDAVPVPDDFHARYWARAKTYEYALWHERMFCLPQRSRYVWNCGPVDFERMEAAARILAGEHDFAAFQNVGTDVGSTVRTVSGISRQEGVTGHESVWRFTATGFLKQMVRNLMGCMVACGRGKLTTEEVRAILVSGDRTCAPATVPPQGLTLVRVDYPA
ncbi:MULTISPECIES: tRNA pseudouridine(38-40) synthase TruA [unclassified Pseudodesulfovibrio]|uniref:tRNA pseudouridine(38-40) synthase TruA n=1 Tax=unclassified Pseudodesulfovibrio TaxID=2661612 RepID=UPI000FEB86D2|nr:MULTISPECIES: tRNA pseudouridine(38-40) synthase TruA [unclassified Pseudodesulfovibrio]MCJ2165881.1 tRNA pseudouridine(38-40) synthase TruA [Pseudodesulfovibrio sp. S3-i]RWU02690.1 tRNA pseudouridine(38-40) synthase TruA [Pseudodesulfovibrio sp. S3]